MFINKTSDGKNNLCGRKVASLRSNMGISQRELADRLQIAGIDIDKNAIQRIEAGKRFVTDIEIQKLCEVFHTTFEELTKSLDIRSSNDMTPVRSKRGK